MTIKSSTARNRIEIIPLIFLLIICVVSFVPFKSFSFPPIASDDWSLIIAPYAFGELKPINLENHRPIDLAFYYVLTSIFGLKFNYFYLLNALILFLSAVMVYALVVRVFPQHLWLASLAAIVYLIYPVDYTRTWIMMLYIRFWWLVSLAAIWFLLDFIESGNGWILALSLLGIIIPLGAYEGQFGVVATATFLIAITFKNKPVRRRLILIGTIILIGLLFYVWRFHIQATITEIQYYSADSFEFNPLNLIKRYFQGFGIFVRGWFEPIKAILGLSNSQIIIGWMLYFALCLFGISLLANKDSLPTKLSFTHKQLLLKSQFTMFLIGGIFWIAGYFPIIGLYNPSLSGHASRVNSYAIAGAAIMVTTLAAFLSTLIARSFIQVRLFAITLLLPFILAGIFIQVQVKIETQRVWETQRKIWQGTFETIPNILDEKGLVILIPSNQPLNFFYAYPFTMAWEIDAGMKVLYNNSTIGGYYYYYGSQDRQFEFRKNGIVPPGTDRLIGYKRLVFVLYHPQDGSVELVENLEEVLSLPFSVNNYSPYENIIPAQPSTADFRWLVK